MLQTSSKGGSSYDITALNNDVINLLILSKRYQLHVFQELDNLMI